MKVTENHSKWLLFFCITVAILVFSGVVTRGVRSFQAKSPYAESFLGDFKVYYTAGLVALSDTDRNLYSLTNKTDPTGSKTEVHLNPQQRSPNPDSTYARFDQISGSGLQYLYAPFSHSSYLNIIARCK